MFKNIEDAKKRACDLTEKLRVELYGNDFAYFSGELANTLAWIEANKSKNLTITMKVKLRDDNKYINIDLDNLVISVCGVRVKLVRTIKYNELTSIIESAKVKVINDEFGFLSLSVNKSLIQR